MEEFKNKFLRIWTEAGGLITKNLASKITEMDASQITRRIQSGELKEYKIDKIKTTFVSLRDTYKIERKRKKKAEK